MVKPLWVQLYLYVGNSEVLPHHENSLKSSSDVINAKPFFYE